jgi:hypothetical protein
VYYYHQRDKEPLKLGRPTPGYSLNVFEEKTADEQIEEYLWNKIFLTS